MAARAPNLPAGRRLGGLGRVAPGAALCLGLSAGAACAQTLGGPDFGAAPGASSGGTSSGGAASSGAVTNSGPSPFAPPSPPLSGGSPGGRDLGFGAAPSTGSPAGGLSAFGVQGGAPGEPTGPSREYTITPRLDVSEAYQSNIEGSAGFGGVGLTGLKHQDDFVTYVTPSIAITADTPRLQGSLYYAPTVQLYAFNSGQNYVGQNFDGSGTLTVLGDALFVNASAFAAVLPRFGGVSSGSFGGFGPGAQNLSRAAQTQAYSYSIEPYAVHRFGDIGTAKIGYTYSQSYNNDNGTYFGAPTFGAPGAGAGGGAFQGAPLQNLLANTANSNVSTSREVGQFTTGDVLGRVRSVTLLSASQYGGGGVESGAYENFFTEQLGYAITHQVTVFAEGGFEQIRYNTFPVTTVDDEVWSAGVQLAPNPDSSLVVGYGHKYGFNSAFANGSYAVTARTRLTVVYSSGLGTALQGLQNTIGNGSLDAFGNPVEYSTGAPTYISSGQLGIAGNNSLYRIQQFTFTAATAYDRDTFSLALTGTTDTLIGTAIGVNASPGSPIASSQSSYSGIGTWRHDLSPDLSASASLTYSRTRQSGIGGTQDSYGADLVLNQILSDTLSGYVRYSYYDVGSGGVPGLGYDDHTIRIGLTKTF